MAWAHVQTSGATEVGSDTTVACAYGSNLAVGSLLRGTVIWNDGFGAVNISTVTDTLGHTWVPIDSALFGATQFSIARFYVLNSSSGANTVTVTFSGACANKALSVREYSGIATAGALDVHESGIQDNPGTGTDAMTTGATANTTTADQLVCADVYVRSGADPTVTVGTGFTARGTKLTDTFYVHRAEDKNLASAGNAVATFTSTDAASDTVVIVDTFKAAGGEAPPTVTQVFNRQIG